MKTCIGLALVAMMLFVPLMNASDYPYIKDIKSAAPFGDLSAYPVGQVTINNPNPYTIVTGVEFKELAGGHIVTYSNVALVPGENIFAVNLGAMGTLVAIFDNVFKVPPADNDGKIPSGMPRSMALERVAYLNQIQYPYENARGYLVNHNGETLDSGIPPA